MPQFVIKSRLTHSWARVREASAGECGRPARWKVSWVGIALATRFPDESSAKSALADAAEELRSAAKASAERVNALGGRPLLRENLPIPQRALWDAGAKAIPLEEKSALLASNAEALRHMAHPSRAAAGAASNIESAFSKYGHVRFSAQPDDYLPAWCKGMAPLEFDMESVAGPDELLSPLEIWFARSPRGWLGLDGRSPRFYPELHQASLHFSREAARDAAANSKAPDCSLVKCQLLADAVFPMPGSQISAKDELAASLMRGCEARDIEEAIANAAQEHKDAIAAAPKRRPAL